MYAHLVLLISVLLKTYFLFV